MSGSTVENDATAQHPPEAAAAAAPLPPPPTQRRPRVREVRSRFMSPVVSSSSSGDLHLPTTKSPVPKHGTDTQPRQNQQHGRSTSAQRRRQLELEPLSRADENRPETTRSLDTPLAGPAKPTTGTSVHKRQPLPRSVKENGDPEAIPRISSRNLRPDTPTVSTSMDRIGSSRLRLTPHHHHNHSLQRSISAGATAAVKLLHATGMSMSFSSPSGKARGDGNLGQDSDSDADINSEKNSKSVQEMRSSMPEADMANRLLERTGNRTGMDSLRTSGSSPRSRPVSSPRSSSEHPMRASERVVNSLCKQLPTPINVGKVPLPPVPPCAKPGADAKKGRKVSSHQEDVHTLRLLHNHYLQWRFANAKAEVSMQAQRREAERMLYSLSLKIADMYDSVKRKRTELATLRRIKNVSSILESQTPYLEEWSALEDDYLASVSEATQALLNASYQLPVGANVRADVREVKEALASAVKIMEAITIHVQSFTAKAEELEVFISELARVAGGERILVEGCGDLLHRTYFSQVEECSLRGQIIQQQQKAMIQCSE
ncbi:protein ENDOSPERM DEFECTIVE 1 isoform X1 [Punica granatum]|uniref:Protein ENDOSPERM DEFECTIVE 1 isoform X1 n=1 Tax=Punica granatum TaxID=22663 RepID=A0A218XL53_PUNGR|nr:protein ENDOSPERM DEFECTIVE 1 isoform X1 [Punica granatum]OWM85683.1 hypothetical protein CDL15_Pgr029106 [Punica granatum]